MYQSLQGNGLIAFSDPAGAKACLALATMLLKADSSRNVRLFSNKSYPFYADWPIEVLVTHEAPDEPSDWLFTGTSHPDSSERFELRAIAAARSRGVPSWAFVDHWTGLALRFQDGHNVIYPDHMVVLDTLAAEKARAEGIPEELLVIHPNPYLDFIRNHWAPSLPRAELRALLGVPREIRHLLLYAPDPLSLRNHDGVWQFDEGGVLLDLVEVAKDLPASALIIKAHPLQPAAVWELANASAAEAGVTLYFVTAPVDPLELMHAADVIIGMHSNFLIEADALRRPILRYFPASAECDAIAHLNIGRKIATKEELRHFLRESLGFSRSAQSA